MQLVILPGNNVVNRTWGEVVRDHYGPRFTSVYLAEYEHWATGDPTIDFDVEIKKLRERTTSLFTTEPTVIMAKSSGALLAYAAAEAGVLTPVGAAFFGIPFDLAEQTALFGPEWGAVTSFTAPTIAFHNVADPTADYRFTLAVLKQYAPTASLVSTDGTDHWYGDFDTYDHDLVPFLAALEG